MIEGNKPHGLEAESLETALPDAGDEPFACPNCGQMLGPGCRVCVACKQPVDLSRVVRQEKFDAATESLEARTIPERVRFPWELFFALLLARLLAGLALQRQFGMLKASLFFGVVEILSGFWVFLDAADKSLPKPLRWALGSAFLWILIFPWYLARRKKPLAACPFVEAEAGLLTRALFFVLMLFFFAGAVYLILNGPPPG